MTTLPREQCCLSRTTSWPRRVCAPWQTWQCSCSCSGARAASSSTKCFSRGVSLWVLLPFNLPSNPPVASLRDIQAVHPRRSMPSAHRYSPARMLPSGLGGAAGCLAPLHSRTAVPFPALPTLPDLEAAKLRSAVIVGSCHCRVELLVCEVAQAALGLCGNLVSNGVQPHAGVLSGWAEVAQGTVTGVWNICSRQTYGPCSWEQPGTVTASPAQRDARNVVLPCHFFLAQLQLVGQFFAPVRPPRRLLDICCCCPWRNGLGGVVPTSRNSS